MLFVVGYPSALLDGAPANASPTANFTFSAGGLTVNFTDTSTDSDGTIASWAWTFGDAGPGTSTLQHPSYTYAGAGTYTVQLTVTDNGGATNAISKSVTVSAPVGGSATRMMRTRRLTRR